jgi:hypothetical protein
MSDGAHASESPYAGLAAKIRPEGSSDAQAAAAERAVRSPLVRVALTRGTALLRLFTEPCCVLLDGAPVGQLSSREKVEATLAAGQHELQVRCGWLRSDTMQFTVENGDVAQFVCTGHNSGLDLIFGVVLFYAALLPHHFYRLRSFRP